MKLITAVSSLWKARTGGMLGKQEEKRGNMINHSGGRFLDSFFSLGIGLELSAEIEYL